MFNVAERLNQNWNWIYIKMLKKILIFLKIILWLVQFFTNLDTNKVLLSSMWRISWPKNDIPKRDRADISLIGARFKKNTIKLSRVTKDFSLSKRPTQNLVLFLKWSVFLYSCILGTWYGLIKVSHISPTFISEWTRETPFPLMDLSIKVTVPFSMNLSLSDGGVDSLTRGDRTDLGC